MKGMSLSINIIVIIAIAVIVLLVLSSFFVHTFTKSGGSVSDTDAWTIGCGVWRMQGCKYIVDNKCPTETINISGYDPDGNGIDNPLYEACKRVFGVSETNAKKKGTDNSCWQKCCQMSP